MSQLLKKPEEENYYNISDLLNKNCMDYAKYVLSSRAIPDLRDGCKPIHRRILWSFYNNKLTYDRPRVKSANAVGGVLAYSPHGEASVYEACVRLANDSVMLELIDGKGSFSSTTARDVQAGASRYTEMRLSKIAMELLDGINKKNVDMKLNYDETRYEPVALPSKFCIALCNPNQGIGVGLSSNICSFNLNEVCDATISELKNEEYNYLVPDFPTGGELIFDEKTLKTINEVGRGSIKVRSKYHVENNSIIITEIPYTTTREAIIEKIIELVKAGKIKEITDINDYTGLDGLNITIDLKKNSNVDLVMQKLFKSTPLEDTFSCNFILLLEGKPTLLGAKQVIREWIKFRKQCLRRELEYDIQQLQSTQEELLGLKTILRDLDKAIALIRSSKSEKEAVGKLREEFKLNDKQLDYIIGIRMVNMNQDWLTSKINKLDRINALLETSQDNLNSEEYYISTIIDQLQDIKAEYGQPRRTAIISLKEEKALSKQEIIEDYNCHIMLTKQGYVKKYLRYADEEAHKLKDEDTIILMSPTVNKSDLIIYTDKANCYTLPVHKLEQTAPSSLGTYIKNTLNIDKEEEIIFSLITTNYEGWLLFAFENGKVAKIPLTSYKSTRTKLANTYNQNSPIVSINFINEDKDFVIASSIDKYLIFNTNQINEKVSRNSQGVQVIKSKKDSITAKCYPLNLELEEKTYQYYKGNIPAVGTFLRKEDSL